MKERIVLETGSGPLELDLRRHPRARRISLRLGVGGEGVRLTIPQNCRLEKALDFARDHEGWIRSQTGKQKRPLPFTDGQTIPFMGELHIIRHVEKARGLVRAKEGEIIANCLPGHLARRVEDWLKNQARTALSGRVDIHAKALNVQPGRISVRDQKTRWGSCSAKGNLNFSWRLVMAPPFVLDYVAAHETAHLKSHDHSPQFWAYVRKTMPEMDKAQNWLKKHGRDLHRYGKSLNQN